MKSLLATVVLSLAYSAAALGAARPAPSAPASVASASAAPASAAPASAAPSSTASASVAPSSTASASTLPAPVAPALAQPASRTEASQADPKCLRDANRSYLVCRSTCREQFQIDTDMCRNVDHDCAETCRTDLDACLDGPDGPLTKLELCRSDCQDALDTAVSSCRAQFARGTPELDKCIDDAQLAAFVCRDHCREENRAGINACRQTFRACVVACPPPPQ